MELIKIAFQRSPHVYFIDVGDGMGVVYDERRNKVSSPRNMHVLIKFAHGYLKDFKGDQTEEQRLLKAARACLEKEVNSEQEK